MKPIKIDWDFVDSHPMADKPDEDSPELTDEDFARMRPASTVLPEIFGAELAAEMLKPKGGRPRKNNPKVFVGIRLDTEICSGQLFSDTHIGCFSAILSS